MGLEPKLGVILAGDGGPSKAYALSKKKLAASLGIAMELVLLPASARESEIVDSINKFNRDPLTRGILLELPLPPGVNQTEVLSRVDHAKDVDGSHPLNRGKLLRGDLESALLPVTPLSCLALLESAAIPLKGQRVTVVGRGETVGLPLAALLIKKDATVTVCHSRTVNLKEEIRRADIVVSATGKAGLIQAGDLREGQVVLDAGINVLPDGSIVGDVSPTAREVVAYLSPVPGGVGTLTTILIMKNLLKAMRLASEPK
jgi:methylenetetrahydrofolate dehydrogenase (NADP+)/methenyltetrahydrofolate cyclohydrolase